jgi:hypothetical protein
LYLLRESVEPELLGASTQALPLVFARRAAQCRKWGARLTRINGVRIFIDEIPFDWPTEIKDNFGGCGFHCATEDVPQKAWYDL